MGKNVELSYSRDTTHPNTGGPNPGCSTIVGGIFHPTKQLAMFSPPNISYIVNSFGIKSYWEAVNYRTHASPPFEIPKPRKITVISSIISL